MRNSSFHRFAWLTIAYNILVILWGAYVRATGSGAGCGSHWPLCNGEVVPRATSTETLIELTHRLTSGVALLLVIALVILAFRRFPKGNPVRSAAVASLVLILLEALLGAGLVLFELVAENESVARAIFMAVHLANTFLLLGALTLTAAWSGREEVIPLRSRPLRDGLMLGSFAFLFLIGMSGAISALGDTLYPPSSLAEGLRQDLSPTVSVLVRLRVFHPFIAVAGSLLIFNFARRQMAADGEPRGHSDTLARVLMLGVFAQLTGGVVNIGLLAPIWMQLTHLLMADGLWILLVLLADAVTQRRARQKNLAASPA